MHDLNGADGELLRRYATRGCEASFAAVVERHVAMVQGVCRRVGAGSGLDPDDVAQVVFATLARQAASLTGLPSVGGWLHRTAWNAASRHRRAAVTRGRHERAAGELRAAADGPPAADATLDREVISVEVHRAVNALPEPYHVAVVLHDLQGWTVRQVADLVGSPVGTVAAHVSRGRQMVRDRLDRRGVRLASALVVAALLAAERDTEAAAGGAAASWPAGDGPYDEGCLFAPAGPSKLAVAALPVAPVTVAAFWGVPAAAGTLRSTAATAGTCTLPVFSLAGFGAAVLVALRPVAAALFQPAAAASGLMLVVSLGFAGAARSSGHFTPGSEPSKAQPGPSGGGKWSSSTTNTWSAQTKETNEKPSPGPFPGNNSAVVPEPGSATVVAAMGLALFARRRRRTESKA